MNRVELFQALNTFRKGLLRLAVVLVLLSLLIFPFSKSLLRHLYQTNLHVDLVAFGVPEVFLTLIKLTLFSSLFVSIPLIFYRLLKSFEPFLRARGMRSGIPVLLTATTLFYLGASFCYFVTLPFGVRFLLGYQSAHIKPMISVAKYTSFCAVFVFGFGLTFELPLVLALLSILRIVNASLLTRNRRYAILLIAVVSAVATPTPDFFNMALMGGPLYLLFEVGVLLVKIMERKRVHANAPLPPT